MKRMESGIPFGAHTAGGQELRPGAEALGAYLAGSLWSSSSSEPFGVHSPWEVGAQLHGGLHGPPHTADVDMDIRVHQDMSEVAGTHAGHSAFL